MVQWSRIIPLSLERPIYFTIHSYQLIILFKYSNNTKLKFTQNYNQMGENLKNVCTYRFIGSHYTLWLINHINFFNNAINSVKLETQISDLMESLYINTEDNLNCTYKIIKENYTGGKNNYPAPQNKIICYFF